MDTFACALLDPKLAPPAGLASWNNSDPAVRFAIYRNNVMVSLMESLADTFPVVAELVGEAFFCAMAREFVRRHPPKSPVLAHYGEDFSSFIRVFEPAAAVPYLGDVAQLEYAYVQAFHAADAPVLKLESLQAALADPDHLADTRMRLHPSVHMIRSPYPVVSIWGAHQEQGDLASVDLDRAEAALVVRKELNVEVITIDADTFDFLIDLANGVRLGLACERTNERANKRGAGIDLSAVFTLLLRSHALSALERSTPFLPRDTR